MQNLSLAYRPPSPTRGGTGRPAWRPAWRMATVVLVAPLFLVGEGLGEVWSERQPSQRTVLLHPHPGTLKGAEGDAGFL